MPDPSLPAAGPVTLVVGEALVDVVHRPDGSVTESPGGSPANVALTLGRLGRSPQLLTALGEDARGTRVADWLTASGVTVRGLRSQRTSTATAVLGSDGAAQYTFVLSARLRSDGPTAAEVLHVGSISSLLDPDAATVAAAVDAATGTALISFDPNIRPLLIPDDGADAVRERVRLLRARSAVVKASDEDVAWLHPGADPRAVARAWAEEGAALVVVTLGAGGAFAVHRGVDVEIAGVPVDVVDTVGAGDTLMGALLDGLLTLGVSGPGAADRLTALATADIAAVLRRAAAAAAVTVSRAGAEPPTRAELDAAVPSTGQGARTDG
ncbi:PfkB family carbohydrate kinase [Mycetocola reblochoni]|uniref:Fructokinase n=2 Tax=Mycetocola reblochoni TaxID=331618 RepID=A0A1R4KCL8_9MICO|nr:PfkB family carbohydrate kinase [Mycetocola reblochoni]RLP69278.1 carbohydrate kinase [Mycetocola reblochoni]SJN42049.1 Fructokinase [Mycetocola reblochoni REB411]